MLGKTVSKYARLNVQKTLPQFKSQLLGTPFTENLYQIQLVKTAITTKMDGWE
jgi:hypothetical protein